MSETKTRVRVYHAEYGCATGCCGHVIEINGAPEFKFDHPENGESPIEFARRVLKRICGEIHIADLDWEHAEIDVSAVIDD